MNQTEVAEKLSVAQSTYATWEVKGTPKPDIVSAIAKLFGFKYSDLIDEEFINKNHLSEPAKEYKRKRRSLETVVVNRDEMLVHNIIEIHAMMRVLLRSQATALAAQQKRSVSEILAEMTAALKDELSAEFDAL